MNVSFILDNVVPRVSSQLNVSRVVYRRVHQSHIPISTTSTDLYQSWTHCELDFEVKSFSLISIPLDKKKILRIFTLFDRTDLHQLISTM